MKSVFRNFLGNHRSDNYREIVHAMLESFKLMKINMSLKVHLLHQHLDFFKENLGKVSDEHGERFHQQIKQIEERFKSKRPASMMAEYVWSSFEDYEDEIVGDSQFMLCAGPSRAELRGDRHFVL